MVNYLTLETDDRAEPPPHGNYLYTWPLLLFALFASTTEQAALPPSIDCTLQLPSVLSFSVMCLIGNTPRRSLAGFFCRSED